MKLTMGLKDGAVLQRNSDNVCEIYFLAECRGILNSDIGEITQIEPTVYKLSSIPAGGPYRVTLSDDLDSQTLTLWVGDVWILAGQSNMEGAACPDSEDIAYKNSPDSNIRCYRSNNCWDVALPILHEPWDSAESYPRETWVRNQLASRWNSDKPPHISHNVPEKGVGPGLFFAKEMFKKTLVPQGVVPCALGGSSLSEWLPADKIKNNLYYAMLRRFIGVGNRVRGVIWSQGENETGSDEALEAYTNRMKKLVSTIRQDFQNNELPFVMAQMANNSLIHLANDPVASARWERLRELQRKFALDTDFCELVATIDLPLDDLIHLSSAAQKIVGYRMAESMASLCGMNGKSAPKLLSAKISEDEYRPFFAVLELYFSADCEFVNALKPSGFSIIKKSDEQSFNCYSGIAKIVLKNNCIKIYTEYSPEELKTCFVKYGGGVGTFCNITTIQGQGMLAFGPIQINKLIEVC